MKKVATYTNNLYKNNEYVKFIVNFLIINYRAINKDVDVFITDSAKKVSDSINYYIIIILLLYYYYIIIILLLYYYYIIIIILLT